MSVFQDISEKLRLFSQLPSQLVKTGQAQANLKKTELLTAKPVKQVKQVSTPNIFAEIAQKVKPIQFVKPQEKEVAPLVTEETKAQTERLKETLTDFARSFPREGAGAGLEIIERINKLPSGSLSITPGAGEVLPKAIYGELGPKIEKFIFGDKPVEALSKQGEDILKGFGVSEQSAKQFGLTTGMVFLGLDLLPPGGDDVIKLLAKTTKVDDVSKILKTLKGVDKAKITDDVVGAIAKTTDQAMVKKMVEDLGVGVPTTPKGLREEIGQEYLGGYRDYVAELKKTSSEPLPFEQWVKFKGWQDLRLAEKGGVKVFAEELAPKAVVNIERLNISQEAKQKIIKISEEIKPQLEVVKGKKLSNTEVIEAAQSSDILRRGTTREATLKSEAILLKTRQHLAELAKNEKLTPEFIDTLRTVSAEATRRGRELQALGIEADPILGTIKTKLVKQLIDMGIETDKIIKASGGIDFNNAQQVMKFYREFVKPTLPEIIDEYRYINMLSSPKTQIVNTFSNILQTALLRPATRLASGVVDNIAHILTGKEKEFYISQVPAYYRGAFSAFGDALSEAIKVMKGQQQVFRPDIKNIPTGLKILKPFQAIPRLMEASDVFFRRIATAGEVEALMSKGVSEAEAVSRAAKTAEELVFRKALDPANKTGQGILLSKIDALTTAVYKLREVPGVKWFVPFVQTPMNILKQGIEYSPLGVTTLAGNTKKIEQFGKTLVGTTVFAGAGWLALKDNITWGLPVNAKDKEAFYAAGMQPYAVKVGDKWVSFSRLGPLAYPIAMASAIKFYLKDNPKSATDSALQKTTKIISGVAEFFADQSYVQGIGDFIDLAKGDTTALSRAMSQIPSQLIPLSSLQRWVANIIDPIYRKPSREVSVEGIIENLKKGIPFLSKQLEPYTDIEGQPSRRQYPIINAFSPVNVSKEVPKFAEHLKTRIGIAKEKAVIAKQKDELSKQAEEEYNILKSLPKDRAKEEFDRLIEGSPELAKEINNLISKDKLGYEGEFIKSLGVENKQRAKYIFDKVNKLETKEEKKVYYQELINKGVVTKRVNEQFLELYQGQ